MVTVGSLRATDPFGYYSAEGPGNWLGTAALGLGLAGEPVSEGILRNLLAGLTPAGKRNLGRGRRFPGWDVVALDPKSLSIFELLRPERGPDLRDARREAAAALVRFLEERCAFARRGAQGKRLERGRGLLVAAFPHELTRALQPGSHTHLLVLNLVERMDGSYGAFPGIRSTRGARDGGKGSGHRNPLYAAKMEAGELYRTVLRDALERRGIQTRDRSGFGFELEGVSDRLLEHFSKRRREVLVKAEELREECGEHVPNQRLLQWAARSSRAEKPRDISLEALRAAWRRDIRELNEHPRAQNYEGRG